jgi:hypothetical protein
MSAVTPSKALRRRRRGWAALLIALATITSSSSISKERQFMAWHSITSAPYAAAASLTA